MSSEKSLADRYGSSRSSRPGKKQAITISVIVAVIAGLVLWWGTSNDVLGLGPSVSFRDLGFENLTDNSVTVNFEITATPGHEVACALQAQNTQFAIVGWKVFVYPPSEDLIQHFSEQLITSEPATTGLVAHCWLT